MIEPREQKNSGWNWRKVEDVSRFGQMFYEETYFDSYGRQQPMYTMNFDGFMLLTMGFKGKKAMQLKLKFIDAFNAMKNKIVELLAEKKTAEWNAIRQAGKYGNRKMCDTIHEIIIPLAHARGSITPDDRFYLTYQKAVNKAAGIAPNSRNDLPLGQLYEVEKIQSIVEISIRGLAASGEDDYKQIYRDTKQTLENYSRLSLIPERFLPV